MPIFEITVPGASPTAVQLTLQVEAGDWLEAMRLGLEELGQEALPPAMRCTVDGDGRRRIHDDTRGRTYVVRELAPPPGDAAPPAGTDTLRGRVPPGAVAPRPLNPFRRRARPGQAQARADENAGVPLPALRHEDVFGPPPGRRGDPQSAPTLQVAAIDPVVARRHHAQTAPTQIMAAIDPAAVARPQQQPTDRPAALPTPARARRTPPSPAVRPDEPCAFTRALPALERPHLTAEQVIDAALDLARDHIACSGIQLLFPTRRADRYQVVSALGAAAADVTRATLRLERWLADLVADRDAATRLVDLDATLTYERPERRPTVLDVSSLLWAPVRHRSRMLAWLMLVDAPGVAGFTESDSRAIDALAATLATGLARHL